MGLVHQLFDRAADGGIHHFEQEYLVNKNKIELNQLHSMFFLTSARLVPDLTPFHPTLAKPKAM